MNPSILCNLLEPTPLDESFGVISSDFTSLSSLNHSDTFGKVGAFCDGDKKDVSIKSSPSPQLLKGSPNISAEQSDRWNERFDELLKFKREYGHCCVPSYWPQNNPLAQWVKRQRYQQKLRAEGKRSTLTPERKHTLDKVGFVWDSHAAFWEERLDELKAFRAKHGHSNIPSKFTENPQLAVWAKCQRRQFKLYCTKGPSGSNMTWERITKLAELGFSFDPRIWKRNERSANPLNTHTLLLQLVPAQFQVCEPTPDSRDGASPSGSPSSESGNSCHAPQCPEQQMLNNNHRNFDIAQTFHSASQPVGPAKMNNPVNFMGAPFAADIFPLNSYSQDLNLHLLSSMMGLREFGGMCQSD
eukprot:Nitzschia sp. Nitz4//scaffold47_size129522//1526//2673//NITZ4_003530-RA/size129522-processed-gene-0.0-mRNA-1//1//CDS//3329552737//6536//frame0